jgi:uncharacterized protein DUF6984
MTTDWRRLTDQERLVLDRLLSKGFSGRDELVAQLQSAMVRPIDDEGSLKIRASGPQAPVKRRVPVEGCYFDNETADNFGPAINLLVHVIDGMLDELEVYKDDGSEIRIGAHEIDPARIEVY